MFRLALASTFALLLLAPATSADEPKAASPPAPVLTKPNPEETARKPAPEQRRRLTTAERWRGKPYLRSSENEFVRGEAMNRALPPVNPGFGTGGMSIRNAEDQSLRARALDVALPPPTRPFNGGF